MVGIVLVFLKILGRLHWHSRNFSAALTSVIRLSMERLHRLTIEQKKKAGSAHRLTSATVADPIESRKKNMASKRYTTCDSLRARAGATHHHPLQLVRPVTRFANKLLTFAFCPLPTHDPYIIHTLKFLTILSSSSHSVEQYVLFFDSRRRRERTSRRADWSPSNNRD